MKITHFILILSLSFGAYAQKEGKILYRYTPVYEDLDASEVWYMPIREKELQQAEIMDIYLYFNEKGSYYVVEEHVEDIRSAKVSAHASFPIYYNKEEKKFYYRNLGFLGLSHGAYLIEDHVTIDWTLTDESKIISGYKSFKAIGNNPLFSKFDKPFVPVEVWYTPDIPVSYGPYKYNGLPGLVLESIEQGKFYFRAEQIDFLENVTFPTNLDMEGKKIKVLDYYRKFDEEELNVHKYYPKD